MTIAFRTSSFIAAVVMTAFHYASADVTMPKIFGDHMVLQQDAKLPVWGQADSGETVTVEFAGQTASAVAGNDRTWRVELTPVKASDRGSPLVVRGRSTARFEDVVVGDVWLASGQSNMEFGLQIADSAKAAIASADDASIRLFLVPYAASLMPKTDIAPTPPDALEGKWQVCSPKVMAARWGSNGFSAVAYFFARELRASTGRPVGMIGSYKGGTAAQTWVSLDGLNRQPALGEFVKRHEQWTAGYDAAAKTYPARQAAYSEAAKVWDEQVRPAFVEAMNAWNKAAREATEADAPAPPKPMPSSPRPQPPIPPDGGYFGPGNLFNGMIAPLVPYAIRGVIWYQGESNTTTLAQALQYETLFGELIQDWRDHWGEGTIPFLYVQLAGYKPAPKAGLGNWIWLRESQANVLKVPNTAMATAVDLGDPNDPHPKDKATVGRRLALAARKLVYGQPIVARGPTYETMKVQGQAIRVSFSERGSGLMIGTPPGSSTGLPVREDVALRGFTIAGDDQQFVSADAVLNADAVIVSSSRVAHPVAVRYDWADAPDGNLYNREGLPATPFRTDAWQPTSPDAPAPKPGK